MALVTEVAGPILNALLKLREGRPEELKTLEKRLQQDLETALWAEKLKIDAFRDLFAERVALYKEVWTGIDIVSFDRWTPNNKGVPDTIQKEQVLFLRHYLIELNQQKGYIFDPASRTFLLDLRWWCKKCAEVNPNESDIRWIYDGEGADFPHGVKLWVMKSGLRRSMVRSIHSPAAGDPSYFDKEAHRLIMDGVKETIRYDLVRFYGPERDQFIFSIIENILPPAEYPSEIKNGEQPR